MDGQALQVGPVPRLHPPVPLREPLQKIEAGQGCSATEGIGGEAVAVIQGAGGIRIHEALEERLAGQGHPHGQEAAGETLGKGHQVGLNAGAPTGKQLAGAAETGEHLIGDQQGSRLAHPPLHLLQEGFTHHAHAAGALQQRFEDHRSGGGLQEPLQHRQGFAFLLLHAGIVPVGGGPGHPGHIEQQGLEGVGEEGALPHGHRPEGIAVIGPGEGHQLAALAAAVAPPLPGHLQGHLHRGGAVIGEEEPLQATQPAQAVGELLGGRMAEIGEDHLLEAAGLIGDRGGDAGFAVAMQGDPPAADRIDQAAAVGGDQLRPLSPHHLLGR